LLCLGSKSAQNQCRKLCDANISKDVKAPFLLSLCGNLSDYYLLSNNIDIKQLDSNTINAIGIIGNTKAIPLLISFLECEDEKINIEAAKALEIITGAGLRETAVETEVLEGFEEGETEEIKHEIERISTSKESWSRWWYQNRSKFNETKRWRSGKLFDFGVCIEEIEKCSSSYFDRQRAYWELIIQSNHDIPYQPDWCVPNQLDSVNKWKLWWISQP